MEAAYSGSFKIFFVYSHAPDKQVHFLGIATYSDKNATFVKWKWRDMCNFMDGPRVFVDFYLESGRENKTAVCMFVCCLCCLFVSSMGSLTSWMWSKSWLVVLFKSSVLHASDCSVTWEHSRIFFFLMVISLRRIRTKPRYSLYRGLVRMRRRLDGDLRWNYTASLLD